MDVRSLYRQMANYDRWKQDLTHQLDSFQRWFEEHRISSAEARHCLTHARQILSQDQFTIACVGEFSRGKTELINALLFAEYGQRLLPSRAGRTTMCPTEIFYEPQEPSVESKIESKGEHDKIGYVRLLPIETRRATSSLQSFRSIPHKWKTLTFDLNNPASVSDAVSQVSATKSVSLAEAQQLGFDTETLNRCSLNETCVEIPAWRHALININHPLLRHGLRILDTPGLNALGNEPELTLGTLPNTQSILYLLAADSGVSVSDMAIWQDHIQSLRDSQGTAVVALLNKIDSLWDDLIPESEVQRSIHKMREITARQLTLPMEHVLSLSAKQGLLAKASMNKPLLAQSNLPQLEKLIAERILENQHRIASLPVIVDILSILNSTRNTLHQRLFECDAELEQLQANNRQPSDDQQTLQQRRDKIKQIHGRYHKQSLSLRSSQRRLDKQVESLTAPVNRHLLEEQIATTHGELMRDWTSAGLSRTMDQFFQTLQLNLRNLNREATQANKILHTIYQRPGNANALEGCAVQHFERHLFSTHRYQQRLLQLQHRASEFNATLSTLMDSKKTVIQRFINTLVKEVRGLFLGILEDIHHWQCESLAPLAHHNLYQKQLLEQHMLELTQINNQPQQNTQQQQLSSLRSHIARQEDALFALDNMLRDIKAATPTRLMSNPSSSPNIVSLDQARRRANS